MKLHTCKAVCTALEHKGDVTAKGFVIGLSTIQFAGTSMLMDVILVLTKLNLSFCKQELDITIVNLVT